MKKTVIVINGSGGVGKDTLCQMAEKQFKVRNVSSITPIKEIAKQCGWNGEKSDRARKFLSDLKRLTTEFNDFPTDWIYKEYLSFLNSDEEIMFVHIREGEEIKKFVEKTGGEAITLLIRGGKRFEITRCGAYGNESDDLVENYSYDYYFVNDLPLAETGKVFCDFLSQIIEK